MNKKEKPAALTAGRLLGGIERKEEAAIVHLAFGPVNDDERVHGHDQEAS